MARVWIAVVPGPTKLPYGTSGHRKHKGPKNSLVDFGKRGTWRIPNHWLKDTRPDPEDGRIMAEVLGIARVITKDMGISFFGEKVQAR